MFYTPDYFLHMEVLSEPTTMGSDLLVALGRATGTDSAFFGLNAHQPLPSEFALVRHIGRQHVPGERICTEYWQLPESKQTYSALGCQPDGAWGWLYGVNEHGVAAGFANWQSVLPVSGPGPSAADLIRVILQRSCKARQAADMLTDLISRYGQRGHAAATDHNFLIADAGEAFVVEAADRFWTVQEIREVRAVSDVSVIRRDWNRIAPGLADFAIGQGWCPADGNKIDFAGAVSVDPVGLSSALRRWGRATWLLENQNGHIDIEFVRRLLSDHYEDTRFEADPLADLPGPAPLCQHAFGKGMRESISFHVELSKSKDRFLTVWQSFGPPCLNVYFPFVFCADERAAAKEGAGCFGSKQILKTWRKLRAFLGRDPQRWQRARQAVAALQQRFDDQIEDLQKRTAHAAKLDDFIVHSRNLQTSQCQQFEALVNQLAPSAPAETELVAG